MKKRLESELISIAHRVLKLKNKSDVYQLYHETQKLYETLSVLKFYHENFEQVKSDVPQEILEEKLDENLAAKNIQSQASEEISNEIKTTEIKEEIADNQEQKVSTAEETETIAEETVEETPIIVGEIAVEDTDEEEVPVAEAKDDLDFEPIFEVHQEEESEKEVVEEQTESKTKAQQISFEDLLGNYTEPVFVKPNDITAPTPKKEVVEEVKAEVVVEKTEPKTTNINEKFAAGINIGLNDRIAFVKNLFANSDEDYNRVISQLNTFDSLQEAREFIEDMVKPDYNDWKGKEEYEERFVEIVERKFA